MELALCGVFFDLTYPLQFLQPRKHRLGDFYG